MGGFTRGKSTLSSVGWGEGRSHVIIIQRVAGRRISSVGSTEDEIRRRGRPNAICGRPIQCIGLFATQIISLLSPDFGNGRRDYSYRLSIMRVLFLCKCRCFVSVELKLDAAQERSAHRVKEPHQQTDDTFLSVQQTKKCCHKQPYKSRGYFPARRWMDGT